MARVTYVRKRAKKAGPRRPSRKRRMRLEALERNRVKEKTRKKVFAAQLLILFCYTLFVGVIAVFITTDNRLTTHWTIPLIASAPFVAVWVMNERRLR